MGQHSYPAVFILKHIRWCTRARYTHVGCQAADRV